MAAVETQLLAFVALLLRRAGSAAASASTMASAVAPAPAPIAMVVER